MLYDCVCGSLWLFGGVFRVWVVWSFEKWFKYLFKKLLEGDLCIIGRGYNIWGFVKLIYWVFDGG